MAYNLAQLSSGFTTAKNKETKSRNEFTTAKNVAAAFLWIPFAGAAWTAMYTWGESYYNQRLEYYENLENAITTYNTAVGNISTYEDEIEALTKDYENASEYVANYEEMLAYLNGDTSISNENNLILQTIKQNQADITDAENTLAAYRDSSALEINATIQEGLTEYQNQRASQALANIYASAGGSVAGAYNSAARRTQASIKALVGNDMVFNTDAEGTVYATGMGSYAQTMLSLQKTIKTTVQTYENNIAAAKLTYQTNLATYAESYETNKESVEDYPEELESKQNTLKYWQNIADNAKTAANEAVKSINDDRVTVTWE